MPLHGRLFLAYTLPPAAQLALSLVGEALIGSDYRRTSSEKLHLTLKFLGEAEEEQADFLISEIPGIARKQAPFPLIFQTIGGFPNDQRPRVIWAGGEAPAGLRTLAAAIEQLSVAAGFPAEERPFAPHVTFARLRRGGRPCPITSLFRQTSFAPISVMVDELVLYRSIMSAEGSSYEPLQQFRLEGDPEQELP